MQIGELNTICKDNKRMFLREGNPLFKSRQQNAVLMNLRSRKPRYSYGEVTVEWKQKKDIDAEGNVCQGGFMIFHFFVSMKMFC